MTISRIEHYRVLLLITEITKFKDGFYGSDTTPATKELDTFLTYLELLTMWDESAKPWQQAVLLANSKTDGKTYTYLMNTLRRVEEADEATIFTVIEVENDRLRKEVQKAAIIDRDRIERIKELLDENKELNRQIEGLRATNDDLIAEASDNEESLADASEEVTSLENKVNDLEDRIQDLEDDLTQAKNDLDDMAAERDEYRRDLRLTNDELDEVKAELSQAKDDYRNALDDAEDLRDKLEQYQM